MLGLLFSSAKDSPEQMPCNLEYKKSFILRLPTAEVKRELFLALLSVTVVIFGFWLNNDTVGRIFIVPSLMLVICLLTDTSPVYVNEECIDFKGFVLGRRRKIFWRDITKLRLLENYDSAKVIAVLFRDEKSLLSIDTDYENFWYVVKMAEQKGIQTEKHKDTLKYIFGR